MIKNKELIREGEINAMTVFVDQITTPNFLQYIGNEVDFFKDGLKILVYDKCNNVLQDLNEIDLFRLRERINDTIKHSYAFHIPIHEMAVKIIVQSKANLVLSAISSFDFQILRSEVDYIPGKTDDEYGIIKYYKNLLDVILKKDSVLAC